MTPPEQGKYRRERRPSRCLHRCRRLVPFDCVEAVWYRSWSGPTGHEAVSAVARGGVLVDGDSSRTGRDDRERAASLQEGDPEGRGPRGGAEARALREA